MPGRYIGMVLALSLCMRLFGKLCACVGNVNSERLSIQNYEIDCGSKVYELA